MRRFLLSFKNEGQPNPRLLSSFFHYDVPSQSEKKNRVLPFSLFKFNPLKTQEIFK